MLLGVFAASFWYLAAGQMAIYQRHHRLARYGVTTTAAVISSWADTEASPSPYTTDQVVFYTATGRRIQTTVGFFGAASGSAIKVRYDPADPTFARAADSFDVDANLGIVEAFVGGASAVTLLAVVAGCGLVLTRRPQFTG